MPCMASCFAYNATTLPTDGDASRQLAVSRCSAGRRVLPGQWLRRLLLSLGPSDRPLGDDERTGSSRRVYQDGGGCQYPVSDSPAC